MKKLFSILTISALTLTTLNSFADSKVNTDGAIGGYFSTGESNAGGVTLNKVWGSDCDRAPSLYLDGSVGYSKHKESGEQTPVVSTSGAVAYACDKLMLGVGLSYTATTNKTVSDDKGVMPMIILGYNGDSARVIGKLKLGIDNYDNQGSKNSDPKIYSNLELGVSKTF